MLEDHVPDTDEVRRQYRIPHYVVAPQQEGESFADYISRCSIETHEYKKASIESFNRWLAEYTAKKQAEAWNACCQAVYDRLDDDALDVELTSINPFKGRS